jgi:hypothetical protein
MYTLVNEKRVPQSISVLYETLRDARNVVTHSPTMPDKIEAMEYVRQAAYLRSFLGLLRDEIALVGGGKKDEGKS